MSTDREIRDPAPSAAGAKRADDDVPEHAGAIRLTVTLWSVVLLFAAITFVRSEQIGIPLRDPDGAMFRARLTKALLFAVVFAVGDAVVRRGRAGWSGPGVMDRLRTRWTPQRIALVASGLLAYHVVYVCYRNLKSWDAFNTMRDAGLLQLEKTLFFGHSPAVLLHDLLGRDDAAHVLAAFYRSFAYLVPLSVVGTLVLVPRLRAGYVFLCSAIWIWILGVAAYYLVPTLGPFASAPGEFAGLTPTAITKTQAEYLAERQHLLANPAAGDAFASISAFASLHVAFTCMVLLMARYYRWRRTAIALGVYLAVVIVATVYFGWHFVVDDVAGILLAFAAVGLGRLMVQARDPGRDEAGPG
jgi:membrane-associated phospholipid phosphatase